MAGRKLIVEVVADTSKIERDLKQARQEGERFGRDFRALGQRVDRVRIGANLERGIRSARRETSRLDSSLGRLRISRSLEQGLERARSAAQRLERQLDRVTSAGRRATDSVRGIGSTLARGATAAAAAMGALATITGVAGVKFDSIKEQATIAFTTMLGSGEKAQAMLDNLAAFARSTPFQFQDLITMTQRLLAMGATAHDVIPELTAIGDAVAGLGGSAEIMDRVVTAMGQIRAKGTVQAEEMRQLAEAGIPAWQFLAKQLGVTIPEAMSLVQKRAVDSQTAIDALTTGMETKFGGMMEKQSHTLAGLWSNFKDIFQQASGRLLQPFFNVAERGFEHLNAFLLGPTWQRWEDAATGALTRVGSKIEDFAKQVGGARTGGERLAIIFGTARDLGQRLYGLVVDGVQEAGRLIAGVNWSSVVRALLDGLTRVVTDLSRLVRGINWAAVGKTIRDALTQAGERLGAIDWRGLLTRIGSGLGRAVAYLGGLLTAAVSGIDWGGVGRTLVAGLASIDWQGVFDTLKNLLTSVLSGVGALISNILGSIDWNAVGRFVGRNLSDLATTLLSLLIDALNAVDWKKVGTTVVDAVAEAVRSVDWQKVAEASATAIATVFTNAQTLFNAIGREIARQLWDGLKAGMREGAEHSAGDLAGGIAHGLSRAAGFFGNVPVVGPTFKALQPLLDSLDKTLSTNAASIPENAADAYLKALQQTAVPAMTKGSKDAAAAVAGAFATGARGDQPRSGDQYLFDTLFGPPNLPQRTAGARPPTPFGMAAPPITTTPGGPRPRVPFVKPPSGKKVTRLDWLEYAVDYAALTKPLADDLRAMQALKTYVEKQIALHGRTLELEQKLLGVKKQIADTLEQQKQVDKDAAQKRSDAAKARQYRLLGLTATGEERAPGVRALRRQLKAYEDAFRGTIFDTRDRRNAIARMYELFKLGNDRISRDVKLSAQNVIKTWTDALGTATHVVSRFHKVTAKSLIDSLNLGLSPRQRRILEAGMIASASGRLPSPTRQFALAGGGGIVVHGDVHLHGVQNPKEFEGALIKRGQQRTGIRRGAR